MSAILCAVALIALSPLSAAAESCKETEMTSVEELHLDDGNYEIHVQLNGGTGKASVESPAQVNVEDGRMTARIVFSSSYYDYVLVDGERYDPVNEEGNSTFLLPVTGLDYDMPVIADTIAMSTPHEIEYTLYFDSASIESSDTAETDGKISEDSSGMSEEEAGWKDGDGGAREGAKDPGTAEPPEIAGLVYDHSEELLYAENFSVDYYEDGYTLLTIKNDGRFLVVPEGMEAPEELDGDITVLQMPVDKIYLVATSAMDFFAELKGLDSICLSGTKADGWYVEEARAAMEAGDILYAGKYNAPDYEQIIAQGCDLAVESTMIYHNPEVKENLEGFGIPVLVERSSYESHPLGRSEWIKLYGILLGREEEAMEIFEQQVGKLNSVVSQEKTGKTVAFFYISSNGYVNVRRSGDYVANMIELAGGSYVFDDLGEGDNSLSTMNMQMEDFYAGAKDADYIIYNSTIDGEMENLQALLDKSSLMKDFKAVKEGHVWCTTQNLFQKTTALADMIVDIRTMLTDEDAGGEDMRFIYPLSQ